MGPNDLLPEARSFLSEICRFWMKITSESVAFAQVQLQVGNRLRFYFRRIWTKDPADFTKTLAGNFRQLKTVQRGKNRHGLVSSSYSHMYIYTYICIYIYTYISVDIYLIVVLPPILMTLQESSNLVGSNNPFPPEKWLAHGAGGRWLSSTTHIPVFCFNFDPSGTFQQTIWR